MITIQQIKSKLSQLNTIEKLIVVNVVMFILSSIFKVFHFSFFDWFKLPSDPAEYIFKPWSIITYAFLHFDFFHILFNMLWLYVVSQWFLNLFPIKLALNIYFLGAISGGLLFMLGYTLLPSVFTGLATLVGASAAVRALLIFLCAYMPNKELRFFTVNIKLWYIGVGLVAFDVIGVFSQVNEGGNMAHIGGALLGYFYAKQYQKGIDIGKGFEKLMNTVVLWFTPSKKSRFKAVYKNKQTVGGYNKEDFKEFNDQKKIDVILDKISKSGYESLTKKEKEYLFRAGK